MFALSMRKFFWGAIVTITGCLIWANNLGYIEVSFKFTRDWPIIVVAAGLMSIWDAMFGRHWWGHKFCGSRKDKRINTAKILEDLEKGDIDAEEAVNRMEGK